MEISLNAAYSPVTVPSLLSKTNSMEACPTGLRPAEPLKITSVMDSPRRFLAEDSPITQRTASIILDLPQPLGPTTAHRLLGKLTVVGSTKDLKPASLIHFKRIGACHSLLGQLTGHSSLYFCLVALSDTLSEYGVWGRPQRREFYTEARRFYTGPNIEPHGRVIAKLLFSNLAMGASRFAMQFIKRVSWRRRNRHGALLFGNFCIDCQSNRPVLTQWIDGAHSPFPVAGLGCGSGCLRGPRHQFHLTGVG